MIPRNVNHRKKDKKHMKSAILVIDVQSVLFDPDPHPFEAKELVQRINLITDWARASNHTVIFILQISLSVRLPLTRF